MSNHYGVRPSEILDDLFDLTGGDKFIIDEIALSDRVQKVYESEMERRQKGVKPKHGFKPQQQKTKKGPPEPQFVKSHFWKNKKWDRWS